MPTDSPVLSFSFIGRLLGYQSVELKDETLTVQGRYQRQGFSFTKDTLFASYQSGWLGGL